MTGSFHDPSLSAPAYAGHGNSHRAALHTLFQPSHSIRVPAGGTARPVAFVLSPTGRASNFEVSL